MEVYQLKLESMAEVRLPEDKLSASFLFMFAARCPGPGVTTTAATLAITNSLSHVSSPFPFISVKVVVEFRWDNFSGGIMGSRRQPAAGDGLGLNTVICPSRTVVLGWAR